MTCSRCDYTTYAEKAALGHDEINHAAKAPTCTAIGWDAYVTCSRCDYTTYAEKGALGHTEVIDKAVAPTCTETGLTEGKHCSVCQTVLVAQTVVDALGHDYENLRCTRCGALNADGQLLADLNRVLAADAAVNGKHTNIAEAVEAALDGGYDVCKIKLVSGDLSILWDSVNDVFCYYDAVEDVIIYIPEDDDLCAVTENMKFWIISDHVDSRFSTYLTGDYNGAKDITTTVSLHLGAAEGITSVSYTNEGAAKDVEFYTYAGVELKVNAPYDNVALYGYADSAIIKAVDTASFHLFGTVGYVQIDNGHFVAEATAKVNTLVATAVEGVALETKTADIAKVYTPAATLTLVAAEDAPADVTAKVDEIEAVVEANVKDLVAVLKEGATKFAGGMGTEADPYLIGTAEHMANISKNYGEYAYYKVIAEEINLAGFAGAKLNGSFNGNGVVFTSVDARIFNTVGTGSATDTNAVVLENFTVKNVGGQGVVRNCGSTNLTFRKINVTGYMIQDWNTAAFLRYGTRNVHDSGFDYTVNFENCSCNAEIFATANNFSAVLIGHTYPGDGHIATVNVDAATDAAVDATKLYYNGTDKVPFGFKYAGVGAVKVYVAGVETANAEITEGVVRVDTKNPVKLENGSYGIATEADTARVVAALTFQYTLYEDAACTKPIANEYGIGGVIGDAITIEVSGAETAALLGSITSVEVKTGDKFTYTLENGKLTLYMTKSVAGIDGWVTLNVEQYTADSNIAKYRGSMRIVEKIAKNGDTEWKVK